MGQRKRTPDEFSLRGLDMMARTSALSDSARGLLFLLICTQASDGIIDPDLANGNPTLSQALANGMKEGVGAEVRPFLTPIEGGRWIYKPVADQQEERKAFVEVCRAKGRQGGAPKHRKAREKKPTLSQPLANPKDAPVPTPSEPAVMAHSTPDSSQPLANPKPTVSDNSPYIQDSSSSSVKSNTTITLPEEKGKFTKATLEKRRQQFIDHVTEINTRRNILDHAELQKFLMHFTQHNPDGYKMLFEMQRTKQAGVWSPVGRLTTWKENGEKWARPTASTSTPPSTADQIDEGWGS